MYDLVFVVQRIELKLAYVDVDSSGYMLEQHLKGLIEPLEGRKNRKGLHFIGQSLRTKKISF